MNESTGLRAAVVGLRMGMEHVAAYAASDAYHLAAVCDVSQERLAEAERLTGCRACFTNYRDMLRMTRPDVVCIAVPTALHADMVVEAASAGVKAIYCEKPMATSLGDAWRMRDACRNSGVLLVIGHQRRVSRVLGLMRQAVCDGRIGRILRVEGSCPGDLLSDGTHLLDSLHFLIGGSSPEWVLGQVYRGRCATEEELSRNPFLYQGTRYGHLVEEGASAVFSMMDGIRLEIRTGTLWRPEEGYHHLELHGTDGMLIRNGDDASPSIELVCNGNREPFGDPQVPDNGLEQAHELLARTLLDGLPHPMEAVHALAGLEMLMGVYESARLRERIRFPLRQAANPLEQMLMI